MKEAKERNKYIRRLHRKGHSYSFIGALYGISRQRAHQIDHHRVGFRGGLFDLVWRILFSKDY